MPAETSRSESSSPSIFSYTDGLAAQWQDFVLLLGRVLLGWIFVQSGWRKLMDIPGFVATMPRRGLPEVMGYIAPPVEFIGGLFLLLGVATRYTALVMLLFIIIASFSSHRYWDFADATQRAQQHGQFWKNVSMMGGQVLLFVTGAGRWSVDWLLARRRAERYSLLPPPICLSLANTASTLSSSAGFFSSGSGSRGRMVVSDAGSKVAPWAVTSTGFSLAARCTSRSRSICEHRPSVTGSIGCRFDAFQWVRSRIAWIVDLVVPTSRMIWLSFNSAWLRTNQRMALGRSWRRDTGVTGPFFFLARAAAPSGRRS